VIVVVILIVVVAIVRVVIFAAINGVVVVVDTTNILEFNTSKDRYGDNGMSDLIGGLVTKSGGDVVDVTDDEDPTNEDGDTGMGDLIGVSVSLGVEIFSEEKKSRESNIGGSDNTGDTGKTVGRAIIAWGGGMESYACGDVFDLIGDVDPTDEDEDIGIGNSIGVLASLGGEIFSGGKKWRESNIDDSDNTGDGGKIVGEPIRACCGIGERASEAKRSLVKSSKKLEEVFPGEAGK
nr:hypothetical protein [Tanacetum cinerariifolium]